MQLQAGRLGPYAKAAVFRISFLNTAVLFIKIQQLMFGHYQPAQFSVRQLHELIVGMFMVRRRIEPHNDEPRIGVIV